MKIETFKKENYHPYDYSPSHTRRIKNGKQFASADYARGWNNAVKECRKMVKQGLLDF